MYILSIQILRFDLIIVLDADHFDGSMVVLGSWRGLQVSGQLFSVYTYILLIFPENENERLCDLKCHAKYSFILNAALVIAYCMMVLRTHR